MPPAPAPPPPGNFCIQRNETVIARGVGAGGMVQMFGNLTQFFDIQFKNTSNLIFLGFKVPSESFFPKDFKSGVTF